MTRTLRHRGPDKQDIWIDTANGVGLGHARLSVIDLSPAGAQPMTSHSGRYVIVFNGEIYNHLQLRSRLEAQGSSFHWRGHSDTETLLAAIETWGLEAALKSAIGMFAFAVWDRDEKRLWLARDRVGEKPLYYGTFGDSFVFGSELKALLAFPGFAAQIDHASVAALLRYLYIPDPHTIYHDIFKLLPGHMLEVKDGQVGSPHPWWRLEDVIANAARQDSFQQPTALVDELDVVLSKAVASQMLSDVPLGSLLSGGIDSSLITALMQAQTTSKVRTYSIGFEDNQFNESHYAYQVARYLGTEHTEFNVTEKDALKVIPELARVFDEPFADSSQIPSIILTRLAGQEITVALSGEGGDEVFGGYNRYSQVPRAWQLMDSLPAFMHGGTAVLMDAVGRLSGNEDSQLRQLLLSLGLPVQVLNKIGRFGKQMCKTSDPVDFYAGLVSVNNEPCNLLNADFRAQTRPHTLRALSSSGLDLAEPARWMMGNDTLSYLPGDILVKMDRAAMASSVETRTPFLDARVLDFAWSLPTGALMEKGIGKRCVRDLLYRYVPQELVDRPKQGFSIPIDSWLRSSLKDWAASLISQEAIQRVGLLDWQRVNTLWNQHQLKSDDHGHRIWAVLMLQEWGLAN